MRAGDLTDAEKRVWDAFPTGDLADFRVGDPAEDDPAAGASWGPERTVRAELIRGLLLDAKKPTPVSIAALRIDGARIVGELDLMYAEFRHRLSLNACSFERAVNMFSVRSTRVSFRGSHLPGLTLARAIIDGDLRLDDCRIRGRVRVDGAEIKGALLADGAKLSNPGGTALHADRVRIGDDLHLRAGFRAEGKVGLRNARVGGELTLGDAVLSDPGGEALDAARIQVDSDVMADNLRSDGRVGFPGARISGLLRLAGAKLSNPGGTALNLYQTRIGANLQCYRGFAAHGDVVITGSRIGGDARFDGAELRSQGMASLNARYIEVTGTVNCREMTATGPVRFYGARIGSVLDFQDSGLSTTDGSPVLLLGHLTATELLLNFRVPPNGGIVLSHAQIGVFADDPATWPPTLYLDGFTCERFDNPGTVADRIGWLARDAAGYQPQPYEHLAAAYRRLGLDGEARRVLLAKQRARRRTLPLVARPWGVVQDAAVGYGYRPERAFGWLAALLVVGSVVFGLHHPAAVTPPTLAFNPPIYTLDLLLPVIDFGQGKSFVAQGGYQWIAYLLTAAGWILATTIAAGVARAVNRS